MSDPLKPGPSGPIAWMARNGVAPNLLMAFFLIGGVLMSSRVKQEVFPEFAIDIITVSAVYRGASPEEVEQGVLLAIEDEVRGLDGVKRVFSSANEGIGLVRIELLTGANTGKALQDVKNAVDGISSFPEEVERPVISLIERKNQVLSLVVHGEVNERDLRDVAERVRDELIQRPDITLVEMVGARPLEIAIEVPEANLRRFDLRLDRIASIVRDTALELPGGGVKTTSGELLLRTQERRDFGREFLDIPVIASPDGGKVLLGDIAQVRDGFEENDSETLYDGERAILINVYRVADETPITISDAVQDYLHTAGADLPAGISLSVHADQSEIFRDRINLLLRNAFMGLALVLVALGLFLEPRLAFWVMLGIPVSVLGAFIFIPFTGASINMISLFAFIVTLGIVVDDAIVVGENIYEKREAGVPYLQAAIEGAREISVAVLFSVLTNVVAFVPLLMIPGASGNFFRQIPSVVIIVFLISLFESLFILPSHLAHKGRDTFFWRTLAWPQIHFERLFHIWADRVFRPVIAAAVRRRYLTFSIAAAMLLVSLGMVGGGHIPFTFFPRIDSDEVTVNATLPFGSPIEDAQRVRDQILRGLDRAMEQRGGPSISRGIIAQIGSHLSGGGPPTIPGGGGGSGAHLVSVNISMVSAEERGFSAKDFASTWREAVGSVAGLEALTFTSATGPGSGSSIQVEFTHRDRSVAEAAAADFAAALSAYRGVSDIDDGVSLGKRQFDFSLRPEGRQLGLTTADMARQVRSAFFGSEALRQQRGRNEVRVMVRLPREERERLSTLENLMLRTPQGGEIRLMEAAEVSMGRAYTDIQRTEGRRVVTLTADVDEAIANTNEILADAGRTTLSDLGRKYPGLTWSFEGLQENERETVRALLLGFVMALLGIYVLLAIPFKSYFQPIIVMLSIPFGIIGAIGGHFLLGYSISMISIFGIIALTGVAVNDSLVYIVTINEFREKGLSAMDAVIQAGVRRIRPILLTSITTFFGLAPMIFERSLQARFIIPMAISLGFGIAFCTVVILFIVPSVYMMLEDFLGLMRRLAGHVAPEPEHGEA